MSTEMTNADVSAPNQNNTSDTSNVSNSRSSYFANLIATSFSFASFSAAILVGMESGNGSATVLYRAMLIMFPAWIVGRVIGQMAVKLIERNIEQYKIDHPLPELEPARDVGSGNELPIGSNVEFVDDDEAL